MKALQYLAAALLSFVGSLAIFTMLVGVVIFGLVIMACERVFPNEKI